MNRCNLTTMQPRILRFFIIINLLFFSTANSQTVNWMEVTANEIKNGKQTNNLFIFHVLYNTNSDGSAIECSIAINEISNFNCKNPNWNGIELVKPKVRTLKDGLICKVEQLPNKIEQSTFIYTSGSEKTMVWFSYDKKTMDVIDMNGNTTYTFPNLENIQVVYKPLTNLKGRENVKLGCNTITLKTIKK